MQPMPDSASSPDGGAIARRGFLGGVAALGGAMASSYGGMVPHIPTARQADRPQAPEKKWDGDHDLLLDDLVRRFEASEMSTAPARRLSERDRAWYDGAQWSAAQLAELAERGQPAIVDNFIKSKADYMMGAERRLRSDPKAFPRTPSDEGLADAATQALRYVTDDNVFNRLRSDVFANIVIEGTGGAEVVAEAAADGSMEVRLHHIPFSRLWWDHYSSDPDFHDARHLGTVIWGDKDQFIGLFPKARAILDQTLGNEHDWSANTYGDRPATAWVDSSRTRVRIVTCHWQHDGDWWTAIFTRGGFLHGPVVSPYVDRRGQTACPLIMRSANVDGQNNRYGLIRDLIPLQSEINARRSKLMHILQTRSIIYEQGAVDGMGGIDEARDQIARPDGAVAVNKGFRFEVSRDTEMSAGQFELLQHTIARMQGHGPNASMTGKDPRELSGRAISLQQAGGAVEQEPNFDGLRLWSRRMYERAYMCVRQFWDAPRWLHVTDDQGSSKFVGINHPVTFGDALGRLPPDQQAMQAQRYGIVPNDPRLGIIVKYENDLGGLDMQITLEEGQDTPTMAAEQFQALMQFASANPGAIPVEVLIQASSLKDKDKLVEQIKEHQQQQAAGQQAQQAAQAQMLHAQLAKAQADAADKIAQAKDRGAQTLVRMHGMAGDHADMQHQPVVPGVGVVTPELNPLMQPQPMPQQQGAPQ